MNYTHKLLPLLAVLSVLPGLSGCGSDDPGGAPAPVLRTLTVTVSGNGTVSSQTEGISNCSSGGGTCSASFNDGQVVTLIAAPGANSTFRAWGVACTPANDATCSLTLSQDRTEVAIFEAAAVGGIGDTFALTQSGKLLSFDRATPGTITLNASITGLTAGDVPVAIDFRPSSGLLYALTKSADNKGRLYLIDEPTATATLVAQLSIDLAGAEFSMDFDPTSDLLRVVSDVGQNLVITPSNGNATAATAVPNTRVITGLAFTNAFKGTRNSVSYAVDSASNELYITALGGDPTFTLIGSLTADVPAVNGFDIDAVNGAAYIAYNVSASSPVLSTVNLSTGVAGTAQPIGVAEVVRGLAIPTAVAEVFGVCSEALGPSMQVGDNCNNNSGSFGELLVRFSPSSPNSYTKINDLTGFSTAGEKVIGLDFRPTTGALVALTTAGKLYTVNPNTAIASPLSTLSDLTKINTTDVYDIDFNPDTGNLRVVSNTDANLRVNPDTGATTLDGDWQRPPFEITAIANDELQDSTNFPVSIALDSLNDSLYSLDTDQTNFPGELTLIGRLGMDAASINGFDIVGGTATAYAAWITIPNTAPTLYSINLTSGKASLNGGVIGSGSGGGSFTLSGFACFSATLCFGAKDGTSPALISFDPASPQTLITNSLPITGMTAGESVIAMEFGPTSSMYVVGLMGTTATLYTVNTGTGAAAKVAGTGTLYETLPVVPFAMDGTRFGFAYEPDVNAPGGAGTFRLVSDTGMNLIINPASAQVTVDTSIAHRGAPEVTAAAYTNNFVDAVNNTELRLHSVTETTDRHLVAINEILGYLEDVGEAGPNGSAGALSGMDIVGGHNGLALFALRSAPINSTVPITTMYAIDLPTGAYTSLGTVGVQTTAANPPTDTRIVLRSMAIRLTTN